MGAHDALEMLPRIECSIQINSVTAMVVKSDALARRGGIGKEDKTVARASKALQFLFAGSGRHRHGDFRRNTSVDYRRFVARQEAFQGENISYKICPNQSFSAKIGVTLNKLGQFDKLAWGLVATVGGEQLYQWRCVGNAERRMPEANFVELRCTGGEQLRVFGGSPKKHNPISPFFDIPLRPARRNSPPFLPTLPGPD